MMAAEVLKKVSRPRRKSSETDESRAAGRASLQAEKLQCKVEQPGVEQVDKFRAEVGRSPFGQVVFGAWPGLPSSGLQRWHPGLLVSGRHVEAAARPPGHGANSGDRLQDQMGRRAEEGVLKDRDPW